MCARACVCARHEQDVRGGESQDAQEMEKDKKQRQAGLIDNP